MNEPCLPRVRIIRVYVLLLFPRNPKASHLTLSYLNEKECLNSFMRYAKDSLYDPYMFGKDLYVTPKHPLYHLSQPVLEK